MKILMTSGRIFRRPERGKDGFYTGGFLGSDHSQILLSIDFDQWESRGKDTPYWVRFTPFNVHHNQDVTKWFSDAEKDGPSWNIPVDGVKKMDKEAIIQGFEKVVSTIVKKYQPFKTESKTTVPSEENTEIEENSGAEGMPESTPGTVHENP